MKSPVVFVRVCLPIALLCFLPIATLAADPKSSAAITADQASTQTPVSGAKEAPAPSLAAVLSAMEDDFVAQAEKTTEPERLFDDYEAKVKTLIGQYPDQLPPFLTLTELFEKCETARTTRLLDEMLGRADLPEKVRPIYEELRRKVKLIGTPLTLAFTAVDGSSVRFDELRGKVVLIDFWATWCGPCVRDLPKLQALYTKRHADGLEVVGISFDRERGKLDSFLKARAISWRQVYAAPADQESLATQLGVTGGYLPTVFLVGRDGRIRHTLNSRFRLEAKVAALLAER